MTVPNSKLLEQSKKDHTDADADADAADGIVEGDFGYKYRVVDGVPMSPHVTPGCYEFSRTIKTRDTDICFVSYPKSGTTWLSYILVLLTGAKGATLRQSWYRIEGRMACPWTKEELENSQSPRLFKSHMPYEMALGGVPAQNPCKYVYIARNPKDVCASYYHFEYRKSWNGYYQGGWDNWFQMFVEGKVQCGDWFDHVLGWWKHKDCESILFLKYEDMKRDFDTELKKIASFIGVKLSPNEIERIKKQTEFSSMKSSEFSNLKDVKEFDKFYRKGKTGSWKEIFTAQQNELFDKLYKERMLSDLTFDFE